MIEVFILSLLFICLSLITYLIIDSYINNKINRLYYKEIKKREKEEKRKEQERANYYGLFH